MRQIAERLGKALLLGASVIVLVLLIHQGVDRDGPTPNTRATLTSDTASSWMELTITFIGDADCPACTDPGFDNDLSLALASIVTGARERGYTTKTVGVAITVDQRRGLDYLSRTWNWDETSLGGGWGNTQAREWVWANQIDAVTPQMILAASMVGRAAGGELMFKRVGRPVRLIGTGEIRRAEGLLDWRSFSPP